MELVERDCVAIWWYNRIPRPEVDLDRFQDPYFQNLKEYYQTLNRDLWVLDITNDFQIPAFAAISRRTDRAIEDIIYGFGAHFDPRIAISRALTEVSQNLASVRMTNADGSTRYPIYSDPVILKWWKTATLENQPYLAPIANVIKQPDDYRHPMRDDLLADVRACQKLVEAKGLEMLVLDQTRPDIGLKVVKVIVPGMRHFWRRLGLGRLYDVPVQLGWLSQPLPEDQLNPVPIWL
jgi:ribosomal protein S12 methylthiotransferase accessory factor